MSDVFVLPMSPAQQRLWFLDQMDPGTTMFNIPAAFRLYGHASSGQDIIVSTYGNVR